MKTKYPLYDLSISDRSIYKFFGLFPLILFPFLGCKKNANVPTENTTLDKQSIVGQTLERNDSLFVTVGSLNVTVTRTSPCYPSSEIFTFAAGTSGKLSNAKLTWYFGDGYSETGRTVSHGYNNAAPFQVLVEAKDSGDNLLQATSFGVKAWGQSMKPVAIFTYKQDFNDNPFYLTFNSASSVNHGSIKSYRWDWGDGTVQTTSVGLVRHLFPKLPTDKNYPVKLTITTDAGCTADTTVLTWVPANYPIEGGFDAKAYDACTKEYFIFTPTATNVPTGSVYNWKLSDGRGDTVGNPLRYAYKYMNDYNVVMYITLNGRTIYTFNKAIRAKGEDPKPKADFEQTWKNPSASFVLMSFNSHSTIAHGAIDGFRWDFGDGTSDNDYNSYVEKTYLKKSSQVTYNVRLIVSGNGCEDTAIQTLTIPKL